MELGEPVEELLDGRRRHVELGDAPRQLREVADQNNPRDFLFWGPRNGPQTPTLVTPRGTRGAPRIRMMPASALAVGGLFLQRLQNLRRRHRKLGETDAGRLLHRVGDGPERRDR